MKKSKYIIFSPHIDDEMIGCWSLLKNKLIDYVYYFFDTTTIRKKEVSKVAIDYNFDYSFITNVFPEIDLKKTLLLPNIKDLHPHHKIINYNIKMLYPYHQKYYYSVEMNTNDNILLNDYKEKYNALIKYYPSQIDLFKDAKYYLFESIKKFDSLKFIKISYKNVKIELNTDKNTKIIYYIIDNFNDICNIEKEILVYFPNSKYRIEKNNNIIYSGDFL